VKKISLILALVFLCAGCGVNQSEYTELFRLVPICPKPEATLARKTQWAIDNAVTEDDWSLSGYSSLTLDSNLNRRRWKIGSITAELEYMKNKNSDPNWRLDHWEDFNDPRVTSAFGIHWGTEF